MSRDAEMGEYIHRHVRENTAVEQYKPEQVITMRSNGWRKKKHSIPQNKIVSLSMCILEEVVVLTAVLTVLHPCNFCFRFSTFFIQLPSVLFPREE